MARAASDGGSWCPPGSRREPARDALVRELPWRAMWLHSRSVPFWIGRDVDGLETICRAAGVDPPNVLVPARRLFAGTSEQFPELRETLDVELHSERDVGAYVSPDDVPRLVEFLNDCGSRIIRVATQHGEGDACSTLLRKVRECARYAEKHEMGYVEASGIFLIPYSAEDQN